MGVDFLASYVLGNFVRQSYAGTSYAEAGALRYLSLTPSGMQCMRDEGEEDVVLPSAVRRVAAAEHAADCLEREDEGQLAQVIDGRLDLYA